MTDESDLVAELIERIEAAVGYRVIDFDDMATGFVSGKMPLRDGGGTIAVTGLSWPDGRLVLLDETGTAWLQQADGWVQAYIDGRCVEAGQGPLGIRFDS